jgi:hypothetical protein
MEPGTSGPVARNSDHYTTEAVKDSTTYHIMSSYLYDRRYGEIGKCTLHVPPKIICTNGMKQVENMTLGKRDS